MKHLVDDFTTMPYTEPEVQGIMILVVVSCASLLAVVALLSAIALSAFNTRESLDNHLFVRSHIAAYFISLLLCDVMQAIGSIINIAWINRMGVYFGNACVLQGLLKQASDVGMALWTLVIAVHSFCLLFWELKTRAFVLWLMLLGGWSAIAALVMLGPATVNTEKRGPFFDVSGYWCWISPSYPTQRITLDYLFMFLAAFLSFTLYILIFLRFRGNIVQNGWRLQSNEATTADWRGMKFADDQAMRVGKQMLLYPAAYIVLVLPIATSRIVSWAGNDVPYEATIFCAAIFLLSGLFNVVLFITTRRILPPESLRIGRWSLSRPPEPPTEANDDRGHEPRRISQATGHVRSGSQSSTETVVADYPNQKFSRTGKPRPPSIDVRRDSIESMYSVYDEEVPDVQQPGLQPPTLTSRWSPDGSPQRRR